MSDEMIIRHCSPTLAGLKTGNVFNCPYSDREKLLSEIRSLNRRLLPKGVRAIPLRLSDDRVLLYIYRPEHLKRDLADEKAVEILRECGYLEDQNATCIARLRRRICDLEEFPHEIGLFLGYPPEDVRGFMENHAREFKCVGCWKVYGDEQKAKQHFAQYQKCTRIYCSQWAGGKSIERLTVAVREKRSICREEV